MSCGCEGGRPGQISPFHWHSAGLELWAALFSWLRGSPERTVGLAEAPREAQRVFHLQQLFRQAHPRTASEIQTPAKYGRRLPTNLLMKFYMTDWGSYISSQLSLIGADLILYLEIWLSVKLLSTTCYFLDIGWIWLSHCWRIKKKLDFGVDLVHCLLVFPSTFTMTNYKCTIIGLLHINTTKLKCTRLHTPPTAVLPSASA